MMIWILIGAVALAAIAALLWPMLRKSVEAPTRAAYDLTIFQDQLKEVDRDLERGVMTAEEAEAARLEIQRRIVAAEKAPVETQVPENKLKRNLTVAAVAIAVPVLAAVIYMQVGSPDPTETADGAGGGDIDNMVQQLADKVAQNPRDIESVILLARTYNRLGKFPEAVNMYRQVLAMEPDANNFSSYGEALVFAAQGVVTKDAHEAFVMALSLDRTEPRARFYLGLEQVDKSQPNNAIAIWRDLTASAPPEAPWLQMVQDQMAGVAKEANIMPMTVTAKHALDFVPAEELALARVQASAPPTVKAERAPQPKPGEITPEAEETIKGMVDGLAKRLESNPDDYNGWLMLGRSYTVLKNLEAAAVAYDKAAALKPNDVEPRLQQLASLMTTVNPEDVGALPQPVTDAAIAVLKINPKQPEALYVSGLARAKVGDKAGARTLWTQAMEVMPADSPLKADLAHRLETLGQ
jgi:cytochrome c-type biogenesis protein CcmH